MNQYYLSETDRERIFEAISAYARGGRAKALLLLSMMYRDGDGTQQDLGAQKRSLDALSQLAYSGDPEGAYEVAMGHLWGDQFPVDLIRGRQLLMQAAELGNADAQFELSNYCRTGQFGFEIDRELAESMLMNAVCKEHPEAMFNYASGLVADPTQTSKAVGLLQKIATRHEKAKELLSRLRH